MKPRAIHPYLLATIPEGVTPEEKTKAMRGIVEEVERAEWERIPLATREVWEARAPESWLNGGCVHCFGMKKPWPTKIHHSLLTKVFDELPRFQTAESLVHEACTRYLHAMKVLAEERKDSDGEVWKECVKDWLTELPMVSWAHHRPGYAVNENRFELASHVKRRTDYAKQIVEPYIGGNLFVWWRQIAQRLGIKKYGLTAEVSIGPYLKMLKERGIRDPYEPLFALQDHQLYVHHTSPLTVKSGALVSLLFPFRASPNEEDLQEIEDKKRERFNR